jgi:hypothetical protein
MKRKIVIPIPKHKYPDMGEIRDAVENLVMQLQHDQQNGDKGNDFMISGKAAEQFLSLITYVWRIKERAFDRHSNEAKESLSSEEVKKICRYVDQMVGIINSLGFEIKDRIGEPFNYGLPESVIATKPQPGITQETVIETVLPTIYFKEKPIQRGEIIIASPENQETK